MLSDSFFIKAKWWIKRETEASDSCTYTCLSDGFDICKKKQLKKENKQKQKIYICD